MGMQVGLGALLLCGGGCLGSLHPSLPILEMLWSTPPVGARSFWGGARSPTGKRPIPVLGRGWQAGCRKGVPELGDVPGVPAAPHALGCPSGPATTTQPQHPCVPPTLPLAVPP